MKQIIIKDLNGVQTHGAQLESPEAWIAECVASLVWGNPARSEIGENGEPTGVLLPAEYTIEVKDITAQLEQERINREALEYLASTDWMIIRELDAGVPCPVDVKQARAEARARIVR